MAVDPASLAITVALTAANMAMTAMQTFEGPRVKGAPATVADYGTPLNYLRGTRLLNCPCFFAKPIQEVRKKRKGKGGKQVTYTGFGSFAIHIADHEIAGVLQVWFDNHLVYDATGSTTKIYPLADDYELEANMRVYLGTETQDPDPDMLAYIEARDGLSDVTPAYRGTSYIYFEGIPLEMLGNRYPDVKVLAAQSGVTLTEPPDQEIEFVGWMADDHVGSGTPGAITFSLADGLASTPATGDLVIVLVNSARHPLASGEYHAAIGDYTPLVGPYTAESLLCDYTVRAYYKFMGSTPDTTFTPDSIAESNAANGFLVLVFRNVNADIIASDVTSISGIGPATYTAAEIVIEGETIEPGTFDASVTESHYAFFSFAIRSATGDQVLPIVMGGEGGQPGGTPNSGNFTEVYYGDSGSLGGARSVRSTALFGENVLISEGSTLGHVLTFLSERAGLESDEYDYSDVFGTDHAFDGYNWSQASGQQIAEGLCDLLDVDMRPHEFVIQALPRGGVSAGAIPTTEFVANDVPYNLPDNSDSALPARVFLTYADTNAEQNPNAALPQGGEFSGGEISIDMQTLAITPTRAQQLTERRQRRERFGRINAEFGLTRQRFALEPGDVYTPSFDGEPMTMRCTKLTVGADGRFPVEWSRDDPAIAVLPGSTGAPAAGYVPDTMPDPVGTEGYVLDTAYLVDAHDQTAPLAYLVAGPGEPGVWTGADFAVSDTGDLDSYTEAWDGIASDAGAVIGAVAGTLPDVSYPWVPDLGSSISVTINTGELTAATLEELILDGTRNLAAIKSGDGWELVQFMTPTLTGTLTYTITGFLRGVRGTEWAMAGHAPGDVFVVLDNAKLRTLGASEIGDEDFYIASTTGLEVDQTTAFSVDYTGASHKPYAPVHGSITASGGDYLIDAERRTRIGGTTLDGQDVPLGEASESWSVDIYDGVTFRRTITGTSLPLTYTAAMITADGGSWTTKIANLYQVNPTLSLRGYPLALAA